MKQQAIARLRPEYSVRACCRALGISRSSLYATKKTQARRQKAEAPIVDDIKAVHQHRFKRYYGSPRMVDELRERGHIIGRHKTARIMRQHELCASKRSRFVHTTDSKHSCAVASNLLGRNFDVGAEQRTWCGDITYLKTPHGFVYLSLIHI